MSAQVTMSDRKKNVLLSQKLCHNSMHEEYTDMKSHNYTILRILNKIKMLAAEGLKLYHVWEYTVLQIPEPSVCQQIFKPSTIWELHFILTLDVNSIL
jgi:hypothetical protein